MKMETKLSAAAEEEEVRRGQCELCAAGEAAVHCESDGARLCWACDARVHAANFLVARHVRAPLCRCCRRPTPWRASGPRLAPTLSLCLGCCSASGLPQAPKEPPPPKDVEEEGTDETEEFESGSDEGDGDDEEEEEDRDDDIDGGKGEGEEGGGENQVVPWSLPPATSPSVSSSSSSDEEPSSDRSPISNRRLLKRMREIGGFGSQDLRPTSSSSEPTSGDEATSFAGALRPAKRRLHLSASSTRLLDPAFITTDEYWGSPGCPYRGIGHSQPSDLK